MRRVLVWLALSGAVVAIVGVVGFRTYARFAPIYLEPPSIILIVIDTLRADYLGCYGFEGGISPSIDELAAESVLFENCSSHAPWTTPSVASMMTSLLPQAHGVAQPPDAPQEYQVWRRQRTAAVPESAVTLAEVLRERGYQTGAFVSNTFLSHELGFAQGFDVFDASASKKPFRRAPAVLDPAGRWLDSALSSRHPYFLYVHLMDVHGPYNSPEGNFNAVRESPSIRGDRRLSIREFDRIQPYLRRPQWTRMRHGKKLQTWRGRYAAGVHAADGHLGQLLRRIRQDKRWQNTVVVLTSDHGEALFDHGGWDHGFSLYEHQLHVPLLIRYPGSEYGGTRVSDVVRSVDIMPTLIRFAKAEMPPTVSGADLAPLARLAPGVEEPRSVFATSIKNSPGRSSITIGRYKLIADSDGGRARLFDLVSDPGELIDIAPVRPDVVGDLKLRLLDEVAKIAAKAPPSEATTDLTSEEVERLRELGYVVQ
jgi:arylsulfatase A-like enzyme